MQALAPEERNYHIFYQLAAGTAFLTIAERERYKLQPPEAFELLKSSGCVTISGVNDGEELSSTLRAMSDLGLAPEEVTFCLDVVAAVLHLGQVAFRPTRGSIAGSAGSAYHEGCAVTDWEPLYLAAELLQIEVDDFHRCIVSRQMMIAGDRGQKIEGTSPQLTPTPTPPPPPPPLPHPRPRPPPHPGKSIEDIPLSAAKAATSRDALAKTLYALLFDWIVARVNRALGISRGFSNRPISACLSPSPSPRACLQPARLRVPISECTPSALHPTSPPAAQAPPPSSLRVGSRHRGSRWWGWLPVGRDPRHIRLRNLRPQQLRAGGCMRMFAWRVRSRKLEGGEGRARPRRTPTLPDTGRTLFATS